MNQYRYMLHPGWVVSQHDGDRHYINAPTLARLYSLPPGSWTVCAECRNHPHAPHQPGLDYIHLGPRYDGDYRVEAPPQ